MANCLRFVISGDERDEKAIKLLKQAAEEATDREIDVEWLSVEDVDEKMSKSKMESVVVCESFEGDVFQKLQAQGRRIVGPCCVMDCVRNSKLLPSVSYPVLCQAMSDVVACCTNISIEERSKLKERIVAMGGIMIGDFTQSVTHLIAGEVGSKKYQVACGIGIPTVQQSWVLDCWSQSKYKVIGSLNQLTQKHLCPCFKGLTICVTGLDADVRHEVKKLTEENGGKYSGELNMRTCTHLIVKVAKGEKYNYARQWKIHCVSSQWFYDCLTEGHWVDESSYEVTPGEKSRMDDSKILDIGRTRVNVTIQNDMDGSLVSSKAAKVAEKSVKSREVIKTANEKLDSNIKGLDKKFGIKIRTFDTSTLKLSGIQMDSSMLLDGCKIYLSEMPQNFSDQFRKLINMAGAMRFNLLNASVTHIIVGNTVSNEVKLFLDESIQKPFVVSPDWLIDSCRMGKMLKEEAYSLIEEEKGEELMARPSIIPPKKDQKSSERGRKKEPENAPSFQLDDDLEEDVFFGQYLPQAESSRISFVAENRVPAFENKGEKEERKERISDELQKSDSAEAIAGPKEEFEQSTVNGTPSKNAFHQCKFVVKFFEEETAEQVRSLIQEFSGKILKQESRCDYVIVPLTYEKKRRMGKKEATICWLEQSLEAETLLDKKISFLFRPFHLPPDCLPLRDCVVTISQFSGILREHLVQLADLLGAYMQDNFVRKATNDLQANTHLLLAEPSGPKYEAACSWGVTCVSKEWLFSCAENKRLMPAEDFPFILKNEEEDEEKCEQIESRNDEKESRDEEKEADAIGEEENAGLALEEPAGHKELDNIPTAPKLEDSPQVDHEGAESVPKVHATPGNKAKPLLQRGKPFRPSFDLGDMMDYLKSPASCFTPRTKGRASRGSFAFDEFVGNQLRKALEITGGNSTNGPSTSDTIEQDCSKTVDVDSKKAGEKAVQEKDGKLAHGDSEDAIGNGDKNNRILDGVVLAVSKKLANRQTEIHNLASILGADYRYVFEEACTHLMHKGKATDNLTDVKQARSQNKFIISEHWLHACLENNARVQEDLYPCSYNPKMALSVVAKEKKSTRASRSNSSRQSKTDDPDDVTDTSPDRTEHDQKSTTCVNVQRGSDSKETSTKAMSPPTLENTSSLDARLEFKRQMEEIMEATKGSLLRHRRQHLNPTSPTDDSSTKRSSVARRLRTRQSSQRSNSDSSKSTGERRQSSKASGFPSLQPSQGDVITYDDPAGRLERERILAQLKAASPSQNDFQELSDFPFEQMEDAYPEEGAEPIQETNRSKGEIPVEAKRTPEKQSFQTDFDHDSTPPKRPVNMHISNPVQPPDPVNLLEDDGAKEEEREDRKSGKFILSAMTPQEKIHYSAMIENLGGAVCDSQYFTLECTHVIVGSPNRNEKFLASVAAGKWVLHKSYLEASREAGYFVPEESHEWGTENQPSKLTSAVKRWRQKLGEKRKMDPSAGAFKGWHVLLCVGSSVKQHGFKRMLEAGSGTVGNTHPPFTNLHGITHAFIDTNKSKPGLVDYSQLYSAGIWVLRPDYIVDYLTLEPPPPTLKYVIPEVQKLIEAEAKMDNPNESKKRKTIEGASSQKVKRTRK